MSLQPHRGAASHYALSACAEYEHWASEIRRLTDEIAETVCPKEWDGVDSYDEEPRDSCFAEAKSVEVVESSIGETRPPLLHEIEERVNDCVECTQLVALIRERKHARQRWGVAKRKVRHAGKLAAREDDERRAPTPAWVDQKTTDDCWTACLASLTGLPLEGFPQTPDVHDAETEIAYDQGVKLHLLDHGWMLRPLHKRVPKGYAIACGPSPRRPGFDHCVVVRDGDLVHDPHPDKTGIGSTESYEIVVPLVTTGAPR